MPEPNFWDVLVVGAGPAGLAAATRAAEAGRSVALIDSNPAPGGQIWRAAADSPPSLHPPKKRPPKKCLAPPKEARRWIERARAAGVEYFHSTTVVDVASRMALKVLSPRGAELMRCDRLILATGARELFLPFPGWTLPGVFGAGGLQALVKGGLDVRGKRVAVVGSGPLLLAVASQLREKGAEIVLLAEQAPLKRMVSLGLSLLTRPKKLLQFMKLSLSLRQVPRAFATWPVRAMGLKEATNRRLTTLALRSAGGRETQIAVDYLACSFGLVPETRLASLLGCEISDGRVLVDDGQRTRHPNVLCAGEPTGIGGVELSLVEGEIAGLVAADRENQTQALKKVRDRQGDFSHALNRAFALRPELRHLPDDETLICRCEDVSWKQVRGAFDQRDAKLKSRCGMGPCQGRICGPALEYLCGWKRGVQRPPLFPTPMSVWADSPPEELESTQLQTSPIN